jgi:predicted ArsR family transcriptional regulator
MNRIVGATEEQATADLGRGLEGVVAVPIHPSSVDHYEGADEAKARQLRAKQAERARARHGSVFTAVARVLLQRPAGATASEIAVSLGAKIDSVNTVIRRLEAEGFVRQRAETDAPVAGEGGAKRRGRPATAWNVVPEKRSELQQNAAHEAREANPFPSPTSGAYLDAQWKIARAVAALNGDVSSTPAKEAKVERERLLDEAERLLHAARINEGGEAAPRSVRAFIAFEEGRVAWLRGEAENLRWAERRFAALAQIFQEMGICGSGMAAWSADQQISCQRLLAQGQAALAEATLPANAVPVPIARTPVAATGGTVPPTVSVPDAFTSRVTRGASVFASVG